MNRGAWLRIENHLERLCKKEHKELFIIAGGIFHTKNKLKGIVTVPDSCFKIVVVLEKNQTIDDITERTPIIAVVMPNKSGMRNDKWETYKTTVRRIEGSTGYKFLSRVDKEVANVLKMK